MNNSKNNPDNNLMIGLGILALGAGAWAYNRNVQRKKLREMLEDSKSVQRALEAGVIVWSQKEKAAERITLTGSKGADEAFAEILSELPPLPGEEGQEGLLAEAASLGQKAKEVFEHQTGIDLDPYFEEDTAGGRVLDTTRSGWSYVASLWEGDAKENPHLSWDQFLSAVGE